MAYYRWKVGLPNEGSETKFIPLGRTGPLEMVPGQVYEFTGDAEAVIKTVSQIEEVTNWNMPVVEVDMSIAPKKLKGLAPSVEYTEEQQQSLVKEV